MSEGLRALALIFIILLIMIFPLYQDALRETKSGGGVISVDTYLTELTAGGAIAVTLADGSKVGQMKKIILDDNAGAVSITPATFADGTTAAIAGAIGNYAEFMWTGENGWRLVGSLNVTVA